MSIALFTLISSLSILTVNIAQLIVGSVMLRMEYKNSKKEWTLNVPQQPPQPTVSLKVVTGFKKEVEPDGKQENN